MCLLEDYFQVPVFKTNPKFSSKSENYLLESKTFETKAQ